MPAKPKAKTTKPGGSIRRGVGGSGAPVPGPHDRMPEGLTTVDALAWREQRRQARRVLLGLTVSPDGGVTLR